MIDGLAVLRLYGYSPDLNGKVQKQERGLWQWLAVPIPAISAILAITQKPKTNHRTTVKPYNRKTTSNRITALQ